MSLDWMLNGDELRDLLRERDYKIKRLEEEVKTLRQKLDQLEGAPHLKDLQLKESLREGLRRYLHSYCANANGRVTIKSVMERTGVDEMHAAQIIKTAKLDKDLY